ncbi:ParM/StbA family protein [Fictibacillus halophilus]|uniref:ParM/StbA family protein n=1 Tax=Fictibacillus halophilus TaxID=1610490 RepID=UPI001CFACB47|nr:ParM/StbA family protein [Fictibacillus halophilus]
MKDHVFIGIDSGKFSTKGILEYRGQTHTTIFRTKLQETKELGVDIQPNSFKIEYDSKQYLLGDMVSEENCDNNLSKESIVHKIAIYTAIVDLMKKAKLNFYNVQLHLAINAPINVYKNQKHKKSYKEFMENYSRTINININDRISFFKINEVVIAFEGMGLIYAQSEDYSQLSSVVIDIGGLNTTLCTFNGLQPDFNSMTVSHFGISSLKAKLEQELTQTFNLNVSANDLEQIVKRGYLSHAGQINEESKSLITNIKRNHLNQIINYAKLHGYTFNQDKIVFSGGGSILLQKEIKEIFPNVSPLKDPQYANTKSFLEIIKVKHSA